MILLDTDHLSVMKYRAGERAIRLREQLETAPADTGPLGTTIVNVEEQMRGWLASIAKERHPRRQVAPYRDLAGLFEFFSGFAIAPFDEAAADLLGTFSSINIKATDRKVAAIALAQNALLLTANKRDFAKIPGLRFENWMDSP